MLLIVLFEMVWNLLESRTTMDENNEMPLNAAASQNNRKEERRGRSRYSVYYLARIKHVLVQIIDTGKNAFVSAAQTTQIHMSIFDMQTYRDTHFV